FRILQRWKSRWMVSTTSWLSMIAPSTMASEDRGSQPSLATWKPRPRPRSLSSTTLTELSPTSRPTRFRLLPNSMGTLALSRPATHPWPRGGNLGSDFRRSQGTGPPIALPIPDNPHVGLSGDSGPDLAEI